MEAIKNYRKEIKRLLELDNYDSISVDLLQYGITEKYYNQVDEAVNLLVDFEKKYLQFQKLCNSLSLKIEDVNKEDEKLCILVDVMRCYDGLNHPTSFITPEGVALLILICRLYNIGCIQSFENLREVDSSTLSISDLTPVISECSYELGNCQSLFLSEILKEIDPRVDELYRVLIYNLCKKIAEVDGVITISEREWLEEIARIDDEDTTNDINLSLID